MTTTVGRETRSEWMTRQGDVRPLSSLLCLIIASAGVIWAGKLPDSDRLFPIITTVLVLIWYVRLGFQSIHRWYQQRYQTPLEMEPSHLTPREMLSGCFLSASVMVLMPFWIACFFGGGGEPFALLPAVWCLTRWRLSRHAAHWGAMAIIASAISCIPTRTLPTDVVWILVFPVIGYVIDQALLETDRRRSGLNHKSADNQPDQFQPNLRRQAKNHNAVTLNPG